MRIDTLKFCPESQVSPRSVNLKSICHFYPVFPFKKFPKSVFFSWLLLKDLELPKINLQYLICDFRPAFPLFKNYKTSKKCVLPWKMFSKLESSKYDL